MICYVLKRGLQELMEPTALRTRLEAFLHISLSPHEISLLFDKFDSSNMGSLNIGESDVKVYSGLPLVNCLLL